MRVLLQPGLLTPLGKKLQERVDLDFHRTRAPVERFPRQQLVDLREEASRPRITHVARRSHERLALVEEAVVDAEAVHADAERRAAGFLGGAPEADFDFVEDVQDIPVPPFGDAHRAVPETMNLADDKAVFVETAEVHASVGAPQIDGNEG